MKPLFVLAALVVATAGAAVAAETAKPAPMTMEECHKHMSDGTMSGMPKDKMEQCQKMMKAMGHGTGGMMAGSTSSASSSLSSSSASSSSAETAQDHAAHHPQ